MMMNCERFKSMLDSYIDCELSEEEKNAMEEHTLCCDNCAELLSQALTASALCAELNEGLTVPLECQTAWRRAVRKEAAHTRRGTRLTVLRRTLSAMAAALVLMLAVGSALNFDSLSMPAARMSEAATYTSDTAEGMTPALTRESGETRAADTHSGFRLVSDGSLDEDNDLSVSSTAENIAANGVIVLRSAIRRTISDSFDNDLLWLDDLISEYGAYFESRTVTGQAEDGSRILDAVIRVPSESLDDFLTVLDDLGTIVLREENAEDITADYTDVSTRLSLLRSQLEQLEAMNETAESVSDLIAIHERATELMAEIESYESTLRAWSSQRSYSSVTLCVEEKLKLAEIDDQTLTERMKEAFFDSVDWLKSFAQNSVVLLAALAPRLIVWVPVAALLIVLIALIFRRKKK